MDHKARAWRRTACARGFLCFAGPLGLKLSSRRQPSFLSRFLTFEEGVYIMHMNLTWFMIQLGIKKNGAWSALEASNLCSKGRLPGFAE